MAGGSGERFWPLSRKLVPKHLLRLFSDKTLLGESLERAWRLAPRERVFVLTNAEQLDAIREAVPELDAAQVIAEPAKRDTAPAAALATALALSQDPEAVVALLPADPLIRDSENFCKNMGDAAALAESGQGMVTLGIVPRHPATGFGYLEKGEPIEARDGSTVFWRVGQFKEKPNLTTAQEYLATGRFLWNAGIFVWRAADFLAEAARQKPELADFIKIFPPGNYTDYISEHFPKLPKISVDYAIMENAARVVVGAAEFDWDDAGSWTSLPEHLEQDEQGNTCLGPVTALDTHGVIAVSRGRTLALCGVSDLIVVETPDAVLVCHKSRAQEIKALLGQLPENLH